jgi:hypothetical protein
MDRFDFNEFTYIENLDIRDYHEFPSTLRLSLQPTSESILFRLLLGTVNLYDNDRDKIVIQKVTYSKIRDSFKINDSDNPIKDWLGKEYGIIDLQNYFKLNNRKNRVLFDELLSEFSWYFINKNRNNHISAFLNLYRALEYISYSFPMIFSSMASNYYDTYDSFKSFFMSKDDGQLKFFNKFVAVLFDESTLRCRVSIDTYVDEDVLNKRKRQIIQKLCSDFESSDNGNVLSISYLNLLDFMINLRNRYFHFESDRRNNISNINFNGDGFFEGLNDKFANWISMIYQEILIHGIYKFNLMSINN